MNPFKRDQHLEASHRRQLEAADILAEMDSDESRALHRYFHSDHYFKPGRHQPDHDHPENDY